MHTDDAYSKAGLTRLHGVGHTFGISITFINLFTKLSVLIALHVILLIWGENDMVESNITPKYGC